MNITDKRKIMSSSGLIERCECLLHSFSCLRSKDDKLVLVSVRKGRKGPKITQIWIGPRERFAFTGCFPFGESLYVQIHRRPGYAEIEVKYHIPERE